MSFVIFIVGGFAGFVFGAIQSFAVGWYTRSWDGGTGILWGIIVGVPTAVRTFWFDWYALLAGFAFALIIWIASIVSIRSEIGRAKQKSK